MTGSRSGGGPFDRLKERWGPFDRLKDRSLTFVEPVEAPVELVEALVELVEAPVEPVEAPVELVETPVELVETIAGFTASASVAGARPGDEQLMLNERPTPLAAPPMVRASRQRPER
ncbi:hypothetical protein GCM10009785_31570 [Brooklawnia cerclae]|uniref:Uncharacterized protein n=1 Tax=Brooklawnia cerclae TaxID=349934 RepID=A0ABX0SDU2_9ACTN|nr:hypothetical protein [Brooklawnia cerclae]NIH56552.1 hypothetical protein [Brooklawnia cerclae]